MNDKERNVKYEKLWVTTLVLMIVCICSCLVLMCIVLKGYRDMYEKVDSIDMLLSTSESEEVENSIDDTDIDIRNYEAKEYEGSRIAISIKIDTPNNKYELSAQKLAMDNNLWYMHRLSPYVSPGVAYDTYLCGDNNEDHWIKTMSINTGKEDTCAADNTAFLIGVKGLDGYGIGGIMIGEDMKDVIDKLGQPSEFSVSDYNKISGATYDMGDYRINIISGVITGQVEYVEVVCLKDNKYYSGEKWWR